MARESFPSSAVGKKINIYYNIPRESDPVSLCSMGAILTWAWEISAGLRDREDLKQIERMENLPEVRQAVSVQAARRRGIIGTLHDST